MNYTGVLSRQDIKRYLTFKPALIEEAPDIDSQLQPNGFDLTIREIASLDSPGAINVDNGNRVLSKTSLLSFDSDGGITLAPGSYLVTCNEVVTIPNDIMALARPRSSLLRCGVAIHTAVWDAGYSGRSQALMVIYNPQGFRIYKNARFMQLVFIYLSSKVAEGYNGIFQKENM